MNNTFTWLNDLVTHFFGFIFEEVVDGLLPALFHWYFVTPYAIDYSLVLSGWHYVRLTTAGFLLLGFFVSGYRALKGDYYSNELLKVFGVTLVFASMSLFILDYGSFGINMITDSFRSPILIEAYKDEKSGLEIVQEGLSDDDIDFTAFSPISVLKYSFGMKINIDKESESVDSSRRDNEKPKENTNTYEDNLSKVKASKRYPGVGKYESMDPVVDDEELNENLYEVFLSENGGAGALACILGMLEILIMCIFALFKFMVQMLIAVLISVFVTKGSFTGDLESLKGILILYMKTIGITLVFNLGWVAASVLTHSEDLAIIHPQFWAIAVYFVVIAFTYYFWVKEIINNIIAPAVQKVKGGTGGAKGFYGKVKSRFSGKKEVSKEAIGSAEDAEVNVNVQTTSTLNNQNDYLEGLSSHERYMRDPEFFRNKDYDHRHKDTRGNFYDEGYGTNYNDQLGCFVKDTV